MSSASRSAVTLEQLVALNDEIAALVRAGVPLESGLLEGANEFPDRSAEIARSLSSKMQSGASLSDALHAEGDRIPRAYRTVVEAGLRAGRLSVALEAIANFSRELLEIRRQIGAAFVYPLIVCALSYGLFLVFMIDLVDRFRDTYETFRLTIHGPLASLIWVSDNLRYWAWIPPVLLVVAILWWRRTRSARVLGLYGTSGLLGWIPGVYAIGRNFQYANFAELLALLLEHDVPLDEGLRLSADATADASLRRSAWRLADVVEQGGSREDELAACQTGFRPYLGWVLVQSARGARPVRLLRHAATFYRRRAAKQTNWFKVVFPMVIALVIGGGVTLVYVASLFGPLAVFWSDMAYQ